MEKPFRPMLATDADFGKLVFPLLASPKLDGVRAVIRDGVVYSRSNKPIPNKFVQLAFGKAKYEHYDGELIVGSPTSKMVYRDTISGVMAEDGEPWVKFFAFDHIEKMNDAYTERLKRVRDDGLVVKHVRELINNMDELLMYESHMLECGYEGLILRHPDAPYKQGRSTVREGWMLKMKRFVDDEAIIVGFQERMHNGNEAKINELGRTKRSSHQANKTGRGDLGALVCKTKDGIEFNIGTGFDDALRASIWAERDKYLGKLVKFKHFTVGAKDAPRHPVFLGMRHPIDL